MFNPGNMRFAIQTYCVFAVTLLAMVAPGDQARITAWGEISLRLPGSVIKSLPFGVPDGLRIAMTGEGYDKVISSPKDLNGVLKSKKFIFTGVPFEKEMTVQISWHSHDGTASWTGSFRFHKPDLNPVQEKFRKKAAEDMAGYIGTFLLDVKTGEIQYSNKYEK